MLEYWSPKTATSGNVSEMVSKKVFLTSFRPVSDQFLVVVVVVVAAVVEVVVVGVVGVVGVVVVVGVVE